MIPNERSITADISLATFYFSVTAIAWVWRTAWRIVSPITVVVQWPFAVTYKILSWVFSAIMLPLVYLGGIAAMLGVFSGLVLGTFAIKLGLGKPHRALRKGYTRNREELYHSAFSSGLCTPSELPQLFYYTQPNADSDDMEFEEPKEEVLQSHPDLLDACPPPQFRCRSLPQPVVGSTLTSATTVIPLSKSLDPMEADYLVFYEDSDDGYHTPRRGSFQPTERTIVEEEE